MTPVTPPSLLRHASGRWQRVASYYGDDGFLPTFCIDDTLWGLDTWGVAYYRDDIRTRLPTQLGSPLIRFMRDRQGYFWGLTLAGDVWQSHDAQAWVMVRPHSPHHRFRLVCTHPDNGAWLAEIEPKAHRPRTIGLWHITAHHETLRTVNPSPDLTEPSCVYEDATGHLWIGTHDAGLFVFDGDIWKKYARVSHETPFGLPSRNIEMIIETNRKQLWVITDDGVATFMDGRWITVYIVIVDSDTKAMWVWKDYGGLVTTELDPRGYIWLGMSNGDIGWIDINQPIIQLPFIPDEYQAQSITLPT